MTAEEAYKCAKKWYPDAKITYGVDYSKVNYLFESNEGYIFVNKLGNVAVMMSRPPIDYIKAAESRGFDVCNM